MRRPIVSIILIISTLAMTIGTFALPIQTQASTTDIIGKAGGCVGGAFIKGLVDKGLKALENKVKDIASNYIKKILGSFISGLLSSSVPTNSSDPGLLGFLSNKYYRDDIIARCIARQMMDSITNSMADFIKTHGRDGGASFVVNWTQFLTQAQYRGENIFRAELSTAQLCDYLNDDVKNSFGVDPKKKTPLTGQNTRTDSLQPFSLSAKCTMPVGFTPQKFQQDFAGNGGWDAFSRMLEPQNNAWGLTMLSQNEIARQRALQQSADTSQAIAGRGYTGTSGNRKNDSCRVMSPAGVCLIYKDIKTTGDYLANSTAAAIGAEYSWLTTSQGLGTIIENITQNMIKRLFDQSDNTGGSTSDTPTIPVPPPAPEPPPGGGNPPNPPPPAPESLLADVQAERTKYGTPMTPTEIGRLLNAVAWKHQANGWALLGKPSGDCPAPDGTPISCDFLVYIPTLSGYDVLRDQEGAGIPTWNGPDPYIPGMIADGSRTLVAPTPPDGGGGGGRGVCADPSNTTAEHTAGLLAAEGAALRADPILADSFNTIANSTAYVSAVVTQLKSSGFNASGSVKDGNDIIHTENLVAVWLSYNTTVERYKIVKNAGAGDMTIADANNADFSGKIPMSCAN